MTKDYYINKDFIYIPEAGMLSASIGGSANNWVSKIREVDLPNNSYAHIEYSEESNEPMFIQIFNMDELVFPFIVQDGDTRIIIDSSELAKTA